MDLTTLTDDELLRYVDRSDPTVAELAKRLEKLPQAKDLLQRARDSWYGDGEDLDGEVQEFLRD